MAKKLTPSLVAALRFQGERLVVRDTQVTGLMVRVQKNSKSYAVQRELWAGPPGARRLVKTCKITLGNVDDMTLDEARDRATALVRQIKRGVDPSAPASSAEPVANWTVEKMIREYAGDLAAREKTARSIADVLATVADGGALADWRERRVPEITKAMARDKHAALSKRGKRLANLALGIFGTAFNHALRIADDPDALGVNPTSAITWHKQRARDSVIMPEDLADWHARLQSCPSPLRRAMHELGLFTGLRPGTLVALRREWVQLDKRVIRIPRMKGGAPFDLPLSRHACGLVEAALRAGDVLHPGSPYLFPARSSKTGEVIATPTWKEAALPSKTGHILRHTYRTMAARAGVERDDARRLMDHKTPGIERVYVHNRALFDRLLRAQERVTREILAALRPPADQKRTRRRSKGVAG